jgi:hypothetical protein
MTRVIVSFALRDLTLARENSLLCAPGVLRGSYIDAIMFWFAVGH